MLLLDSEVISPEVKSQAGASAQGSHQRVKFLTWVHCLPELNDVLLVRKMGRIGIWVGINVVQLTCIIDKETEIHTISVTCPRSWSNLVKKPRLELKTQDLLFPGVLRIPPIWHAGTHLWILYMSFSWNCRPTCLPPSTIWMPSPAPNST